jgi:hypothetical protein
MTGNDKRAERGYKWLQHYLNECEPEGEEYETAATDLIADILHFLHQRGEVSAHEVADRGIQHYLEEIREEEGE